MALEDFKKSNITADAVIRNLEIIGEAAAQIKEEKKKVYAEVPWRTIQDFRNIAIHKYFEINFERVWDIIEYKLDELKQQIKNIINKESKN